MKLNLKDLRAKFINDSVYKDTEFSWVLETPYDTRDNVLLDIVHNYKTNFAKQKKQGGSFTMQFKRKKDLKSSMDILSKYWNNKKGKYHQMYSMDFEGTVQRPKNLYATSRLIYYNKLKQWYLAIPRKVIRNTENQCDRIISLDPGVRTFLTGYSNDNHAIEFAKDDISGLARLLHHKNKIQSKITKAISKTKRSLEIAKQRLSKKIKDLVTDAHRKIIKFLANNYNHIYIPKLNFHNIKTSSKKTRAKQAVWNHCLFVDRLVSYCGYKVTICTEEYTSKTCSCCGFMKEDLGSNKTFECNSCKNVFDRDINAAKNILLKNLRVH